MAYRTNSGKPICHACNRPFDPSSPGATLTMGPTCAKRAALGSNSEELQLALGMDLGSQERPQSPRRKFRHSARQTLPHDLQERYVLAKMAFDELYRAFCGNGTVLHGTPAQELEQEIRAGRFEEHSFDDPLLDWLEPEHELALLIDRGGKMIYLRRVINGVKTILEIQPDASLSARNHVQVITGFTHAMKRHRDGENMVQLSLAGFDAEI